MTPDQARRTAQHARRLLTARIISPFDYACLDVLLWRCRRPGRRDLVVDYQSIARLAGVCRDTAIGAVKKLAGLGLIQKILRRARVKWGRGRDRLASRQLANAYMSTVPATESATPAADSGRDNSLIFFLYTAREKPEKKGAIERALEQLAGAAGLMLRPT